MSNVPRDAARAPSPPPSSLSAEEKRKLLARLLEKKTHELRIAPLSHAQQRLWFLDQLAPGSPFYNMPVALRLNISLDVLALSHALDEIVRRHEALRTTFAVQNGQQVQMIAPLLHLDIPVVDLQHFANPEKEARLQANEEARNPFDLATGPLIRARLLRLAPQDHVLLLTLHHIIADGWSLGILFRELTTLYVAFTRGDPSPFPDLPIQYADYAVWQRQWLEGNVLQEQLVYWKRQLADLPVLDLPTDLPRPAISSFLGARRFFTLSEDIVQPLAALGRATGTTMFMTLFAAFQVLLHRYSGQVDFAVGAPIASRTRTETEGLIGFFVNTLVLRADLSNQPSFRELLKRTRETTLAAYAHQDLPFERLVEEIQPSRDGTKNPLVQVMFALQNAPNQSVSVADSKIEVWEVERGTANFDLVVDLWELGGELGGRIEYSTELFHAATIERLLGHLSTLLAAAGTNPDQKISLLPMLTQAERQQLSDWNATQYEYPATTPIAHLFEDVAANAPDAPAITFGSEQLTYCELNARANQIAHYLNRLGVGSEDLVGVYLERSAALITAMLGILKAGAAYLPLDIAYPEKRLAFMIGDAQPRVVLTEQALAGSLSQLNGKIVCLDAEILGEESTANPVSFVPPVITDALAYVMYTSGSTGKPKAIEIPQRGVNRLVCNTNYIQITSDDRIAQASSTSFDAATFEIWGALLNGAHLIGLPKEIALSSSEFGAFLRQHRITTLFLTTAVFNQIARECPGAFLPLKNLLFGGEVADPKWVREVRMHAAPSRLLHVYGPTECTTFATWHLVETVASDATMVPIGCPVANTTAYVLDKNRQPVPIGVPGELFIGGPGVARGYSNHPELTAERFIQSASGRLYRSGDIVRYGSDGSIEFLGRQDSQVKLRGFRVELEEIQAVLSRHPAIQEAVVTFREDTPGDKRIVAYLVAKADDATTRTELIGEWQKIYDDVIYEDIDNQEIARQDPSFNIIGWKSTYTGQAISPAEMREQVDQTIERLAALGSNDVLEIGCGTGLLLFRMAPGCRRYWATDFSETALDYVRRQVEHEQAPRTVRLFRQAAHDFTSIADERFDTIVLNSVVQYFPDIEYLMRVIEQAVSVLKTGGHIFIGDVRCLPLLEVFHTAVELGQAAATMPTPELHRRIRRRVAHEQELVIDPAFFLALRHELPQIGKVSIQPKRGRYHNELTRFRYDVVLQVSDACAAIASKRWNWCQDGWSIPKLQQELLSTKFLDLKEALLVFERVPNARTWQDAEAARQLQENSLISVGELRNRMRETRNPGIDPEQFWSMTDDVPYTVEVSWAAGYQDGSYDVIFRRGAAESSVFFPPDIHIDALKQYANNPRQRVLHKTLVPELREFLKRRLPDYMIPSAMVLLETLPLTANGKVDHQALPAPDGERPALTNNYIAPRSALETLLANLWAKILGLERVGVTDSFFDLGGQSLLATQLLARINELLKIQVPLKTLFAKPAVADFCAALLSESGPGPQHTAELLVTISNMPEDDAARLLSIRRQERAG
jgi:amino acid adenylation domain-containing protein